MRAHPTVFLALLLGSRSLPAADKSENKVYLAARALSPPVVDGKLDDACWSAGTWATGFVEREPREGEEPGQQTLFEIAYDDRNLYVAIRAYDSEPQRIERRVARRDTREGDQVALYVDSYFDRRTAFAFNVSAAGVKTDSFISEGGDREDYSWDAIWYADVQVDGEGWTAELQVPFSQIRFGEREAQVWGLQVSRFVHRTQELSTWQFIPRDAAGLVPRYGELHGVDGIKPRRQLEIVPYVLGKLARFESSSGNPFATGRSQSATAGLDGKLGVTSDLTLSFTANPDFGQVEADPSEVNLTTYETFFPEKRPFFIEGRNIFNFQVAGGDGDFSADNLFYSRRIGRTPRYEPETVTDEYLHMPAQTSILGALKLTGKTRSGLSVGVLEAVTASEAAEIDLLGARRLERVEPLTSFFVGRLQKDFARGNTILGGMWTATLRDLGSPALVNRLHRAAYTGGVDFEHSWKDRSYYFSAKTLFSQVRGDPAAILETQKSPVRYFQRPDVDHVSVDPERNSLSGHGGTLETGKSGSGHIRYTAGVTWRSPGLELNDVGFLRTSDRIMQWAWGQYALWKPRSVFLRLNVNVNQWKGWDFGGTNLFDGGNVNANATFKNYWSAGTGLNRQGESLQTSALRGGPALRVPGGWGNFFYVSSDDRKKLRVNFGGWNFWGDDEGQDTRNFWFGVNYRPTNALSVAVSPSFNRDRQELQYVATPEAGGVARYVFANIRRTTVALTVRLNYSVTPNFSIQYYGQPFVSAGDYSRFKRITNPRAQDFTARFESLENALSYDAGDYVVDEDGDGVTDYRFNDPDFNFRQFRSNLVVRWEYSPGSALFVVWSQDRTGEGETGAFAYRHDVRELFSLHPRNVFLVKFSRSLLF